MAAAQIALRDGRRGQPEARSAVRFPPGPRHKAADGGEIADGAPARPFIVNANES